MHRADAQRMGWYGPLPWHEIYRYGRPVLNWEHEFAQGLDVFVMVDVRNAGALFTLTHPRFGLVDGDQDVPAADRGGSPVRRVGRSLHGDPCVSLSGGAYYRITSGGALATVWAGDIDNGVGAIKKRAIALKIQPASIDHGSWQMALEFDRSHTGGWYAGFDADASNKDWVWKFRSLSGTGDETQSWTTANNEDLLWPDRPNIFSHAVDENTDLGESHFNGMLKATDVTTDADTGTSVDSEMAIMDSNHSSSENVDGDFIFFAKWGDYKPPEFFERFAAHPNAWQVLFEDPHKYRKPFFVPSSGAYTITAEAGAYTLTGQTVDLLASYVAVASAGSFLLTGQTVDLMRAFVMAADAGAYTLNGQDVSFVRGLLIAADAGAYTLSGQDVTLLFSILLSADAGVYALTGQDVTLLRDALFDAETGTYLLDGQNVNLVYDNGAGPDTLPENKLGLGLGLGST